MTGGTVVVPSCQAHRRFDEAAMRSMPGLGCSHCRTLSGPKIRAIPGPSLTRRPLRNAFSLVNSGAERVPPADEEPACVVLAEEARLLLEARGKAPDLGFHPSGALRATRSRPGPTCVLTPNSSHDCTPPDQCFRTSHGPNPGSALGYVTLTDALPLVHGLLDETVRLLSKAVKELGVVAKENLDALAGAAGALGRVHSGVEPERDPGVTEIVRPLGQARSALSTGQGVFPGPRPCDAVGGSVHVVASLVPEKSTVSIPSDCGVLPMQPASR